MYETHTLDIVVMLSWRQLKCAGVLALQGVCQLLTRVPLTWPFWLVISLHSSR